MLFPWTASAAWLIFFSFFCELREFMRCVDVRFSVWSPPNCPSALQRLASSIFRTPVTSRRLPHLRLRSQPRPPRSPGPPRAPTTTSIATTMTTTSTLATTTTTITPSIPTTTTIRTTTTTTITATATTTPRLPRPLPRPPRTPLPRPPF